MAVAGPNLEPLDSFGGRATGWIGGRIGDDPVAVGLYIQRAFERAEIATPARTVRSMLSMGDHILDDP